VRVVVLVRGLICTAPMQEEGDERNISFSFVDGFSLPASGFGDISALAAEGTSLFDIFNYHYFCDVLARGFLCGDSVSEVRSDYPCSLLPPRQPFLGPPSSSLS